MHTCVINFKKALFAAIILTISIVYVQPKTDFTEELSQINNPWENMGIIFYDEYLSLHNDYNLPLNFILNSLKMPYITAAGILVGGISMPISLFIINNKITKKIPIVSRCTKTVSNKTGGISKYWQNIINRKTIRNKIVLETLLDLWLSSPSYVPEEMHSLCKKLYDEYQKDQGLALEENASLAEEIHQKVLQKSEYYRMKHPKRYPNPKVLFIPIWFPK